eukprot:TRINITY_DN32463_c0_g1_i1.p1 TRINITY_DN32463_c0_g1~~TRINITY_DN32463_c0_g1_i1.p1  ORF type:complete len:678 (-),score=300.26 TRINITY_DN32463_c0_g1_i1:240-2273(-)
MSEIKAIVDGLNQPPFNKGLTQVAFDEMTPLDLLVVLNEILAYLSSDHAVDMRQEPPDQTALRVGSFLRIMQYRSPANLGPEELGAQLVQGDRGCTYHVMNFLFSRLQDLKKRAYLAKYLINVDIPQELLGDEEILTTYQQHKELQRAFTQTHKQVDMMRNGTVSPDALREKIGEVESEKKELDEKIGKLKARISHDDPDEFLKLAASLRRNQEGKSKVTEGIKEQRGLLKLADERLRSVMSQRDQFREIALHGSPTQVIQAMEKEAAKNRQLATVQLPQEINEKTQRLQQVEKALEGDKMTEFELGELSSECNRLKAEIGDLERKAAHPADNDRLHLFRPQAQQVTNRKKDMIQRLQLLQEERDHVDGGLKAQQETLSQFGEEKVLTGDDFANYAKQLRTKYAQCQKLKAEENEIKSELTVLNRTEQILKSRSGNVEEAMKKMEVERGITGYRNQQEDIAKVSEAQEDVNMKKQSSLEELSAIVLDLTQKIKDQKLKLKEPIRELKYVLRPKYKELGDEYREKKSQFESCKFQHEGDISNLRNDVKELEESCNDLESRWHQLNAHISILSVHSARLSTQLELKDQDGRKVCSYRELYASRIKHAEMESKTLREQQKQVKLMYEPAKEQMQMFENLRVLLECKRNCLANVDGQNGFMGGEDGGHAVTHMSENVMQLE